MLDLALVTQLSCRKTWAQAHANRAISSIARRVNINIQQANCWSHPKGIASALASSAKPGPKLEQRWAAGWVLCP